MNRVMTDATGWWRHVAACLDALMNRLLLATCDAPTHRLELIPAQGSGARGSSLRAQGARHGIPSRRRRRFMPHRMRSLLLLAVICLPLYECSALAAEGAVALVKGVAASPQAPAKSKSPVEDTSVIVTKEVVGKLSAINPKDHMLTVIYQQDKQHGVENEIFLSLQDDVELRSLRNLHDLKFGDTIKVSYDEQQQDAERKTEDGKSEHYTKVLSREAKMITFIKSKSTGLVTNE